MTKLREYSYIVFKGKPVDIGGRLYIKLPLRIGLNHIEGKQHNRLFDGRNSSEAVSIRAKLVLDRLGVGANVLGHFSKQYIDVESPPKFIEISDGFIRQVRIKVLLDDRGFYEGENHSIKG